ncbi:DUF427 domain-containing protein [Streptomyces sp. NPDC052301]|uniref:DUF427 domain-containing protein n=1 Tax=Streptomyces sp. NPDC052301 TaxID=3365687 RepID=UPI0037CFEF14
MAAGDKVTHHEDLGDTTWYAVHAGDRTTERAAWEFSVPPRHVAELKGRVAFAMARHGRLLRGRRMRPRTRGGPLPPPRQPRHLPHPGSPPR